MPKNYSNKVVRAKKAKRSPKKRGLIKKLFNKSNRKAHKVFTIQLKAGFSFVCCSKNYNKNKSAYIKTGYQC